MTGVRRIADPAIANSLVVDLVHEPIETNLGTLGRGRRQQDRDHAATPSDEVELAAVLLDQSHHLGKQLVARLDPWRAVNSGNSSKAM